MYESIYEMIDAGMSLDEIKREVEDIVNEYKEEEAAAALEEKRDALIDAFIDYMDALGVLDDDDDEDLDDLYNLVGSQFIEMEENIQALNDVVMNKSKKEEKALCNCEKDLRQLVRLLID